MHYSVSRLIALAVVCASAQFARADLINVFYVEQGSDVVVSWTGSLNMTGWKITFDGGDPNDSVQLNSTMFYAGGGHATTRQWDINTVGSRSGTLSHSPFGPSFSNGTVEGENDFIVVTDVLGLGTSSQVLTPAGYVSGTFLSGSLTLKNTDFSSLGMALGQSATLTVPGNTIQISAVPEPSNILLAAVALGCTVRRRRR
ncbi:MAG: PEP-CTERM sorting domain-containing protein [Planctomycetales bacterium]|nr:PEP-CTERM sorting domain-containing protein [Planctomycetales bacterium]